RQAVSKPADQGHGIGPALARYYDLDVFEEHGDLPMYLALAAASDGPVLELACGSGRLCVPLVSAGHTVVGVDRDPDMLNRARAAWATSGAAQSTTSGASLELVEADMTELDLDRRFDLVILAFNSLMLLPDRAAQERVIHVMRDHLTADGRVVIDVWRPTPDDLELYDGRPIEEWARRDAETGEQVSKTTSARYDAASARATVETHFDASRGSEAPHRTSRRDEIQFVSADELLTLVETAGLRPQMVAGDYSMGDLAQDSERLIVVAAGPNPGPNQNDRDGATQSNALKGL
ncbi:MAG: class I SAM-dependent methyltransferase, partial [Chloroflexota bacterium]